MGRQVNFFMYGEDEPEFLSAVRNRESAHLLPDVSTTESFKPLPALPSKSEPRSLHLWLWDSLICKPPVVLWVPQQRHYTIDGSASEVIEFSRSYERDGSLVRGRIWAEFTGWQMGDPEVTIEKSPEFRKWFNSLASWIKKHLTRTPEGWYVGPGAREFQRRGGRLVQADFASLVKVVQH